MADTVDGAEALILMTALATIFSMLPLALGVGSGAQLLQPLAKYC